MTYESFDIRKPYPGELISVKGAAAEPLLLIYTHNLEFMLPPGVTWASMNIVMIPIISPNITTKK